MDILKKLCKHTAYKHEDIELLRKRVEVSETIYELKELICQYNPTDKVTNELGEEHYKECWESRARQDVSYDQCELRCLCGEIEYLSCCAETLLDDIKKIRNRRRVKRFKRMLLSLILCCAIV